MASSSHPDMYIDDETKINERNATQHIENPNPSLQKADLALAGRSLGTAQLEIDGKRILVPTPSNDPNDPLLWSQKRKYLIAAVACCAALLSNFVAAGPTVAIVKIAMDFTKPLDIPKTAYFFNATSIMQGVSNLVWIPSINKYGRRMNYIIATMGYMLTVLWCALSTGYTSELLARMALGFFAGGAECLAPLVIADIFFLHERGRMMACYNVFLSMGVAIGIVVDGLIVLGLNWRWMYWIFLMVLGALFVIVFFFFEETCFRRNEVDPANALADSHGHGHVHPVRETEVEDLETKDEIALAQPPTLESSNALPARKNVFKRLAFYNGTFTEESLLKMFCRPFIMIFLPAVFYATWIFSVTIGFLVAITSNFAVALGGPPYNFTPTQSGLCFIAGIIGSLIGIPMGGHFGDWVVRRRTHQNGGIFQPEYRLPAIAPCIITGPLALLLYGVGIQHGLHWMVPTLGLGFLSLTICAATNIAMTYTIDVYKPVAGEVIVAILAFKACFGFALAFGTNLWIALEGYQGAFGEMAGICAFFLLLTIPMTIYGARLRQASFKWRLTGWILWAADRDDVIVVMK